MRVFGPAVVLSAVGLAAAAMNPGTVLDALRSSAAGMQQPGAIGSISGRVVDARGSALPGITVDLLSGTTVAQTTSTDARGEFRFERVAAGVYAVRARREGLAAATVRVVVGVLPSPALTLSLGVPVPLETARETLGFDQALRRNSMAEAAFSRPRAGIAMGGPSTPSASPNALPPGFVTAGYDRIDDNRFRRVTAEPLSTFSIDVDTASYTNVRRFLNEGTLPPADAVRIEELINYFRFGYPNAPADAPFSVTTELAPCPWNPRHKLALVGLQARRIQEETPPRNLVFLLDVSGSMASPDRLPLVKTAMRLLVDTLTARDRVAIVVYAGASGLALPSTPGDRKAEIQRALGGLDAAGSTNGAEGIRLAYDTAAAAFVRDGVNRVILATDGDFNVGVTSQGELVRLIETQRARGIFLSVLGVGTDNLQDSSMEKLADRGNGNYAYLDSLHEARRVLIEEAGSTFVTVAKDVKIQVEFNPRAVGAYRLVGYENRLLNREDFNDDTKDAGEIGAGHTVTALYEVIPPGEPIPTAPVDPLIYQEAAKPGASAGAGELMTVKLRYKKPDGESSQLMSLPVRDAAGALTPNIGFAAAVAQFGMLLRSSEFKGQATWSSTQKLAREHSGEDPSGYRAEFVRLVDLAAQLATASTTPSASTRRNRQ